MLTNLKKWLKNKVANLCQIREITEKNNRALVFEQNSLFLRNKTFSSKECGISSTKYCDYDIVVSLTTYGKRLQSVYLTIESIMQGSIKPNRIILWLDDCEDDIPISLQKQVDRGLEIKKYKPDIRSYKKLIPTLQECPNDAIITIDDDLIYSFDLVENLLKEHLKYKQDICANRVHRIIMKDGKPISYMKWSWCSDEIGTSNLNFLTGIGGVLYPPHCFSDEVLNEKVFTSICKFADDVWFYAMALLNSTQIRKTFTKSSLGEDYIINESLQDSALCNTNANSSNCMNDIQLNKVLNKYDLFQKLNK